MAVVARAPTRLDFGGGWTDVPPYCEERGGYVCSVAVARYATAWVGAGDGAGGEDSAIARAAARRVGGVDVRTHGDFPSRAGLGGSSAIGVAALGALAAARGEPLDRAALAELSRRVEVEDLGVAGGRQDHYAAAFGGALGLAFTDRTEVERIVLSPATAAELGERCVVTYTGRSRISARTITGVLGAYAAGEPRVVGALARMAALARLMATALGRGDLDELGRLVGEHWVHQRTLHPEIATPAIDAILECGRAAGAVGGKALGASGGGCVLLVAPAGGAGRVRAALAGLGEDVPVAVDLEGLTIVDGAA